MDRRDFIKAVDTSQAAVEPVFPPGDPRGFASETGFQNGGRTGGSV